MAACSVTKRSFLGPTVQKEASSFCLASTEKSEHNGPRSGHSDSNHGPEGGLILDTTGWPREA